MTDALVSMMLAKGSIKQWKKMHVTRKTKRHVLRTKAKASGHDIHSDPNFNDNNMRRKSLIAFNGEVFLLLEQAYSDCARGDCGRVYEMEYSELMSRIMDVLTPDMSVAERNIIIKEEWLEDVSNTRKSGETFSCSFLAWL